ncbi:LiaF domain-containing protein [Bacteroidota bacterium]
MGFVILFGVFMILLGIGLVVRVIFHLDFPVGRFILALFIIFIGVKLLFGHRLNFVSHRESNNDIIFSERSIDVTSLDEKEYNVIFGSANIDLTNIDLEGEKKVFTIHAVFSGVEIKVSENIPLVVTTEAVFGAVNLPKESVGGFGSSVFKSGNFDSDKPHLYIKASSVFGGIKIKYR